MIEEWFNLYADDIYSFLVYMVKDAELAKDLTQDTFVLAIRGIHKFRQEGNPKSWLFAIARNVALSHLRSKKREVATTDSLFNKLVSSMESPEQSAERQEIRALLFSILDDMKPEYRAVIVCREVLGMSSNETAQALGWTSSRVRVTLHRALKSAKKQIAERGIEHGLAGF
ncbi:RNA polymerase subunit sigma [Alicyclobacillus contaminans]|uniref:RNA polymerase sigma factor n=1 Tax=Alicyclobacillus contaminans TaxID=392016 RepID=UPI0003FDFB4C|nr:sigma-70 family RNA polymerase sigma factor [Alicyclobacillus contaminans]GMA49302.1 RNA polymerase subunit sigma [Alicyclobacillus contaminans]